MAGTLKKSSDIDIENHEAPQLDGASTSPRQDAANRLRRHLSRTITQPRGLFESIIDAYGPISESDVLQAESSQVDEAYRSLHASCSSDTETCSSHEDGQETQPDSAHDRQDGTETRGGEDHIGQKSRSRRRYESQKRGESQKRSDEEWAKSILTRRTGYGCLQRNQVSKYITQLETYVGELQLEVSKLSPQVILLDHHRWILQAESDTLKQKIAKLSRYQLIKKDENSALQTELHLLRIQRADRLEQAERQREEEARADLTIVQQLSQSDLSDKQRAEKQELEQRPQVPRENSREQAKAANLRTSPSSQKEPQAEGIVSKQLSLVKWPSSLYRSVSAIRKDVLDVALEESTVK